jgi:hypothetical protein
MENRIQQLECEYQGGHVFSDPLLTEDALGHSIRIIACLNSADSVSVLRCCPRCNRLSFSAACFRWRSASSKSVVLLACAGY